MLQPMRDVIVLVPGILGSVLAKDGREVWGASAQSIALNLRTFGRAIKDLKLEQGIGHEDPKDGVSAPRILPRLFMIPTFWKADGYGRLAQRLTGRFTLTAVTDYRVGNLIEFPYDWRLSNQLNAQRLADAVIPHLERWRSHTQNGEAKLILICHSMGGLIARWFLEILGGREVTRTLITIGTPYQGAVNALDALVNGVFLGLGSVGMLVDELVRSFASVYQLLPTYECLDLGDGQLRTLSGRDVPNIGTRNIQEATRFHARVSAAVQDNPVYRTFAIKGVDQPTFQSALLRGRKVELLRSHKGRDHEGDGTVPRPSSHPPEWPEDVSAVFASQRHAMLQSTDSILTQLSGILTGDLGKFMGGARIGVDIPEVVEFGSGISIDAVSKDGDPALPLRVVCQGEDGLEHGRPILMRPTGDGRYNAKIDGLPEGAWRITVQSAALSRPVEPVSDWILVWNPTAA
jgi:pimeloyl-ACP methyl ester carboxylesterase